MMVHIETLTTSAMKHFNNNSVRSARSRALRGSGTLLAWLFCLALVVAALPGRAASSGETARRGSGAGQRCTDRFDVRTPDAARGPSGTRGGQILSAAPCATLDPASPDKAVRASRGRGVKFAAKRYPRADAVVDAASPALPSISRNQAVFAFVIDPSGHFPSAHPGRAPPAARRAPL
jgi:hypothetical protein